MPNGGDVSLLELLDPAGTSGRMAVQAAILAKRLYANNFSADRPERGQVRETG